MRWLVHNKHVRRKSHVGRAALVVALRKSVGQMEETRDHDDAPSSRIDDRDTVLPDGCSAQLFLDKVNELVRDHVPWLERPLEGAAL